MVVRHHGFGSVVGGVSPCMDASAELWPRLFIPECRSVPIRFYYYLHIADLSASPILAYSSPSALSRARALRWPLFYDELIEAFAEALRDLWQCCVDDGFAARVAPLMANARGGPSTIMERSRRFVGQPPTGSDQAPARDRTDCRGAPQALKLK